MHLIPAGEAATTLLYSYCGASRHHNFNSGGVRKLSRHSVRMVHLYTHVTPKAGALPAWHTKLMIVAHAGGIHVRTTWAWAARARARPALALRQRDHCDPQPSAAAHRQLSTLERPRQKYGSTSRGEGHQMGPRDHATRASNTVISFAYNVSSVCSSLSENSHL